METRISARLTPAEGRRFGLTVGSAFLVLAAVAAGRGRPVVLAVFATIGVLFAVSGLAVPARLGPVFRAWMKLGQALSRVTTPVILGAMFFLVVTPTGVVMRILGRRTLARSAVRSSFWVPRPADPRQRGHMRHQF